MLRRGRKDIGMALLGLLLNAYAAAQIIGLVNGVGALASFTPYSDGQSCVQDTECASTHCVDKVCCMQASCATFESCNLPGHAGTCTRRNPAPALSVWAQLVVGTTLLVFALRRLSGASRPR